MSYFLDSYAMLSYLEGNKSFSSYFEEESLLTSSFNIAEIYYHLLLRRGERLANDWTMPFVAISTNPTPITIKNAMKFRLVNKKKSFSYADAIGYQIAKERGLKFLTGDQQFKGMPNVEFVK